MVPSSPSPPYYLTGGILAGCGAILPTLRTAFRRRPWPRGLTFAAVLLLAVGLILLGAGYWMDVQFAREQATNTLTYDVSIRVNGTGPVTILLPAPVDTRFYSGLNTTSGSSTLRVVGTPPAASVLVVAHGNVTLWVQVAVYPAGNDSYTRVAAPPEPFFNTSSNASIELDAMSPGTTVLLSLIITIFGACQTHYLSMDTVLRTGVQQYPARYGYAFC